MYCSTLVEQILLRMAKAKQESPPLRIYAIGPTQKHKKNTRKQFQIRVSIK